MKMKISEELKRKIGQLFMVGVPDNGLPDEYMKLCEKYYIGNFTLNAKKIALLGQGFSQRA